MTLDPVDQANRALQADPKAAKTVKNAVAEIVTYLHGTIPPPPVVPPVVVPAVKPGAQGERYLDMRVGTRNLVLGESPAASGVANAGLNGPNLRTFKASTAGVDTLPGWDNWLELTLHPHEPVSGGGRYMISTQGMDPGEPGWPGGHPSANTPEGYFNGQAWHRHGQTYGYLTGYRIPAAMVPLVGSSVICTVGEFCHADAVIDGAWPTSFYPTVYHGHNATGLLLAANRPGLVQQFTPRPGDGFLPALTDTTPWWAFKMGFGDVTAHDNIATWALRPVVGDETVWFAVELKKHDLLGTVNVWTKAKGLPLTQRIAYAGSTNQFVAGTAPFDEQNPRSNKTDQPQRLTQHPCFTLGPMVYNGSADLPISFRVQSPGLVRYPDVADALKELA